MPVELGRLSSVFILNRKWKTKPMSCFSTGSVPPGNWLALYLFIQTVGVQERDQKAGDSSHCALLFRHVNVFFSLPLSAAFFKDEKKRPSCSWSCLDFKPYLLGSNDDSRLQWESLLEREAKKKNSFCCSAMSSNLPISYSSQQSCNDLHLLSQLGTWASVGLNHLQGTMPTRV